MRERSITADDALAVTTDPCLSMDEDEFRSFYDATVHPLHANLTRLSGDVSLADDLAQEAYCRFLEVARPPADANGRRRYVFRIATNLFHDHYRRTRRERGAEAPEPADDGVERRLHLTSDVGRARLCLTPRQRSLLWLAYVEGLRHREIADVLGLSTLSVKPLLFRARRRLAGELRARGLGGEAPPRGRAGQRPRRRVLRPRAVWGRLSQRRGPAQITAFVGAVWDAAARVRAPAAGTDAAAATAWTDVRTPLHSNCALISARRIRATSPSPPG